MEGGPAKHLKLIIVSGQMESKHDALLTDRSDGHDRLGKVF